MSRAAGRGHLQRERGSGGSSGSKAPTWRHGKARRLTSVEALPAVSGGLALLRPSSRTGTTAPWAINTWPVELWPPRPAVEAGVTSGALPSRSACDGVGGQGSEIKRAAATEREGRGGSLVADLGAEVGLGHRDLCVPDPDGPR